MVYLGDQPVQGFSFDDERAEHLRAAFQVAFADIKAFEESLTPREKTILALGLAASHLEESLVHGDWKRADAHADNLVNLLKQLGVK